MYRYLVRPLLFLLSPETAHRFALGWLRFLLGFSVLRRVCRGAFAVNAPGLRVRALGLDWSSPVLLAAGFDKNAEGFEQLAALGFAGVEVGTITAQAQSGNARPRLFRLPKDRALINRMGFNNDGAQRVAERLRGARSTVVGVNIGRTKGVADEAAVQDYVASAALLGPFADYVVVNVSSPNTPGLRALQSVERLRPLLAAVQEVLSRVKPSGPPPLLVKIAPDLSDEAIDEIADLALDLGLSGIIATNTTISREELATPAHVVDAYGSGGLSGAPLRLRSLSVLRRLRRRVGDKLVLIAAGGIETADDAWERIRAGATLVQIYTAFVYEGPSVAQRIALGLVERADGLGLPSVQAAVGSGADRPSLAPVLPTPRSLSASA